MEKDNQKVSGYSKWALEVLQFMERIALTKKQAVATVATLHQCDSIVLLRAVNRVLQRKVNNVPDLAPGDPLPKGYRPLKAVFKDKSLANHLRCQGVFTGEFGAVRRRRSKNDSLGKYYVDVDGALEYVAKRFPKFAPTVIGAAPTPPPQQQKLPDIPKEIEQEAKRDVHTDRNHSSTCSAGWRSRELGSLCLKFDPTCSDGSGARYNPLLEIRMGDQEVRDAQNVADILVDPNGDRIRDHWDRTAHSLLVGLILHVLYAEKEKTLAGCAHFLARPDRPIDLSLEVLLGTEHAPPGHPGWRDPVTGEWLRTHPTVAAAARALMDKSPNERSGVLSTALSFLDLYRDPILAQNTAVSDFALEDLVSHERPVSLYLTVPPSDLIRTRPLVRLLLNQACRRLTERMDFSAGRGRGAGKHPLLLMLDEFPALGKLQFFQESLAYLAGYDIRAMLITQDLSQHQGVYGKQESITANCHVRIAFAANKPETAELLSQMAGDTTVSHKHRQGRL